MARWRLTLLLLLTGLAAPLQAQELWDDFQGYLKQPAQWQEQQWWTLGGIALLTATAIQYDESTRSYFAASQSPAGDKLAVLGNGWGELQSLGGLTLLSLYASGKLTNDPELVRLSADSLEAVLLSGLTTHVGKLAFGRLRPYESSSAYAWGQGGSAFPSGHTTMAFALSTVLAESGDHPGLGRRLFFYSLAGLTAYARMYDQRHWLSDTVAGAAIGINAGLYVVQRHRQSSADRQTRLLLLPNGIWFYRELG